MGVSTRFLLLVIIGVAIAVIGMHLTELFFGIAFLFTFLIGFYALPLFGLLALLVIAWRLIAGIGSKPEKKVEAFNIEPIKSSKPKSHIEIERELNRMKHEIGQMNK